MEGYPLSRSKFSEQKNHDHSDGKKEIANRHDTLTVLATKE